jgi:hypothetical protein
VADDVVVRAWVSLPRRIYLDTSTLQKLYDFGREIFENEPSSQSAEPLEFRVSPTRSRTCG